MKPSAITYILFILITIFAGCSRENNSSHSGQLDMQQSDHSSPSGKTDQDDHTQHNRQIDLQQSDHSEHSGMEMEYGEPADESIYHVSSTWKDQHGHSVDFDVLRGKVQVLAMVYTYCEFACPRILADMKRIEKDLTEETRQYTNFVIVSIDPQRDTPERLLEFAVANNLSSDSWTLLNGSDGDILEIAALLGVRYKRISDTDFTHSNMISVLNREGEIVHQRKQLYDDQADIIRAIENEF
ncbi:MAG: SCO family protein [Rhodothermaceae bacterium]|nr:SCO family protein [Rhodothermaceae bacterium]